MAFTHQDREALRKARIAVAELEIKEQQAIDHLIEMCRRAGVTVTPGTSWHTVVLNHADAIIDALAPFDSGYRAAQDDS